jgi:hypothetical protein
MQTRQRLDSRAMGQPQSHTCPRLCFNTSLRVEFKVTPDGGLLFARRAAPTQVPFSRSIRKSG